MDNFNNLSREELIRLLSENQRENERQAEQIKKQAEQLKTQEATIGRQEATIGKQRTTIGRQEAEIKSLHIQIEELIAKYEDKLEASKLHLVEQYVPKSEVLKDDDLIINELEVIGEKKKRKSPTESFINDLKGINRGEDIIIDYDFSETDTSHIKPFGEDETWKLEYKPASFEVRRIIKKKYKDRDRIYEGSYDDPFPHSPLTPSLAANLIEMKFNLGVPFYRYSNYLKAHGINISDADISNYASGTAELLEPLYKKLLESLINNKHQVIHSDETPLKVINSDKAKCYMFVYTTSFWDNTVYIYDFNDSRSTDKTKELLKDYKGYLVCDGYAGYDSLINQGIKIQRCMVHARRYFNDVLKVLPESEQKKSPAYKVISLMAKIFGYEAAFRKDKLTAERIREERNGASYRSAISNLNNYIDSLEDNSSELLAKAVNYYNNHKKELYIYLDSGYVDMTNNLAERTVKPFVIARKNFLFCKTADGAITTGKLFSIVQTARANGLKSELYLAYVIANIGKIPTDDLLPWSPSLPEELKVKTQ